MKVTFESKDRLEINRLAKSLDMACALFEINHNLFRTVEHNAEIAEEITRIINEYDINLTELIE